MTSWVALLRSRAFLSGSTSLRASISRDLPSVYFREENYGDHLFHQHYGKLCGWVGSTGFRAEARTRSDRFQLWRRTRQHPSGRHLASDFTG